MFTRNYDPNTGASLAFHEDAVFGNSRLPGNIPTIEMAFQLMGSHPDLVTNSDFGSVLNSATVNPTLAVLTGKNGYNLYGAGAATDAHQYINKIDVLLNKGRTVRLYAEFAMGDVGGSTGNEIAIGLATAGVGTNVIATEPNNQILFRKLKTQSVFHLISKKATGQTDEDVTLPTGTLVANTVYAVEMLITPDAVTANKAKVQIWFGPALQGVNNENKLPYLGEFSIAAQCPANTVELAFVRAWRQGSTSTTTPAWFGKIGWEVEAA